jgi:ribosomal protein L6P/L9E
MAGISRTRSYRMKITQNNINVKLALPAPTTAEHPGPVTYEVRDLET